MFGQDILALASLEEINPVEFVSLVEDVFPLDGDPHLEQRTDPRDEPLVTGLQEVNLGVDRLIDVNR